MLRLTLAGPDTHIESPLCAACPHSPAGCCVAPPRLDWSDVARIVVLGGRDWLLEQHARGNIVSSSDGFTIKRVKGMVSPERGAARVAKCVFHGHEGCTVPASRRPATCNFYVCDTAFDEAHKAGDPTVLDARRVHGELVDAFVGTDERLRADMRAAWPDGPQHTDAAFLDWLGALFVELWPSAARS